MRTLRTTDVFYPLQTVLKLTASSPNMKQNQQMEIWISFCSESRSSSLCCSHLKCKRNNMRLLFHFSVSKNNSTLSLTPLRVFLESCFPVCRSWPWCMEPFQMWYELCVRGRELNQQRKLHIHIHKCVYTRTTCILCTNSKQHVSTLHMNTYSWETGEFESVLSTNLLLGHVCFSPHRDRTQIIWLHQQP